MKPVKGVFWIVEGRLLAIPFDYAHPHGLAKSGDIYVHKKNGDTSDRRAAKKHIIIIREGELKQRITEVQLYI